MKKIISTLLILAMVLTMALTVSADANFDKLNGTYNVNFVMDGMWVLTFTPTSLAGGTLTVVDNYNSASGVGGDYTWTYDPSTQAVTVYDGAGDPTSNVMISWNMGGDPTFQCPALRTPQNLVAASPSGGEGGDGGEGGSTSTDLALGANSISVDAWGCTVCTFTATVADTYTFTAVDGETNGDLMANITGFFNNDPTQPEGEWVGFPYSKELAAGETLTIGISTLNWQADTVDFTISGTNTDSGNAGGGNTGSESPENGDNAALYVAVGAVALASIFGCAIVSKKRIAE